MSNSFSFGGGNDSSLNPLAFDSPVVRERHSRYSRLTESFNISRIASQTSCTAGGLFNDTTASIPVTPKPFHNHHHLHQTSLLGDHFGGGVGGGISISNISDIGNSISLNTTLQLGQVDGGAGGLNTSGEGSGKHKDDHGDDVARLAIFESFYELSQQMAGDDETFDLLQQFDQACDVNLLACKEMLERKVRPDSESAYLSKFCSLVRLERNSWRLLAALYNDRLVNRNNAASSSGRTTVASSRPEETGAEGEEAMDVEELVTDSIHLRLSDLELAERALKRNAALREMQIVIDWLESIYDEETLDKVQFYSDGPSYWENTLHALKIEKQKKNAGSGVSPARLFSTSFSGGLSGSGTGSPGSASVGMDKGRQYCQQMDPDASIRSGLPLHDLDKDDENRLFHYLYRLVRAGQLQDGKEIAERQGYFWLSAALDGWILHHDPNYKPKSSDDGADEGDVEENNNFEAFQKKPNHIHQYNPDHLRSPAFNGNNTAASNSTAAVQLLKPVKGNPYRDLWKLTAWKCSKVEGTNLYERALFAVFSGNRAVLLPLCPKWTDKLWAYFKCSLDVHLEDLLSESNIPKPDLQPRTSVRLDDAYWDYKLSAEEIFRELNCGGEISNSAAKGRHSGGGGGGVGTFSLQIEEEYHQKVEQLIILGQVEQLVDRLYEWAKTIAGRRETRARQHLQQQQQAANASFSLFESGKKQLPPMMAANRAKEEEELAKVVEPNLLRFFAHLVIALRNFDLIKDEKQEHLCHEILETYIGFLIEYKLIELVAFYSLRLPEHRQVVVYATLLEGIEDETDRKLSLLVAKQSNLNLPAILATVVENIRTGNLGYQMAKKTAPEVANAAAIGAKKSANLDGSFTTGTSKLLKPQIPLTSTVTEEDRRKIAALDWLLLEPSSAQYVELLVQGNALLRAFLLEQKVDHARTAFEKLPTIIVSAAFEQWKTAHLQAAGNNAIGSLDIDNVVREYICHRTFFEAQEAFQKWHHYLYNSKPREPSRPKNLARLADRVAFEQATKAYEQELAVWQTAISAQAATTAEKLLAFLRFPDGIWVTIDDLKLMAEMAEQDAHLAAAAEGVPSQGRGQQHIKSGSQARENGFQDKVTPTLTTDVSSSETMKMLLEAKVRDWSLRAVQLDALRRIYVPQFIFLLLSVHRGSGNLAQAVAVADIVADERTRLYATFTAEQLGDFLAKVREASIDVLEMTGGGDPLGYGTGGSQKKQQQ